MIRLNDEFGSTLQHATDLGNFSRFRETDTEYQTLVTWIHDAVLKAGKADFRMVQNLPMRNDGYKPPARGGQ